jgi:phosphate-selective porin OprO/OprP
VHRETTTNGEGRTTMSGRETATGERRDRAADDGRRTQEGRGDLAALASAVLAAALLAAPLQLAGQQGGEDEGPTIEWGGLLRTGVQVGPADLGRDDGFRIHDARLRASGEIGIVFDYFVQGGFDDRTDELRLLDARLSLPIVPQLAAEIGQFKAPFGREALQGKGEITFVERSQVTQLVAPGRQVGLQLAGEALDDRLLYRGGVFNGTGRGLDNDGGGFLWAARARYAPLGTARFYDELKVELGASVAFSSDSAAPLAGMADRPAGELTPRTPRLDLTSFRGDRFLWGVDLEAGYRGFFVRGEYLRGEFDPETPAPPGADGDVVAEGAYVEGGYSFLGAIEGVVRWDALNGVLGSVDGVPVNEEPGEGSDFLVIGLNLFPGYETKIGLQYAVGLAGARRGPALADGEFALNAQVDF